MYLALVALLCVATAWLSWPLARAMERAMCPPDKQVGVHRWAESAFRRIGGRAVAQEQDWVGYSLSLLLFNAVIFAVAWAILALQHHLPLNPDGKGALETSLIFNTVASFVTNTNLQHYSGEASLSHFSQLFALMWLQFVTPVVGLASLTALARGLSGKAKLGNFYLDLLRGSCLVMLPLALVTAVALMLAGVPMTVQGAAHATTLEGATQAIARGPVAAFVAIKQLGTNGGGFFGPNATHPFENPNIPSNMIECACILLVPMACVWLFGRITGRMRHAAVIFAVMSALLIAKLWFAIWSEGAPAAAFSGLPIQVAPNLEGKELRFGSSLPAAWCALTTATSNGSVNCMHDSLNPLTGLVPLVGMWLNDVFGGVGVGLVNMFVYIVVGVFICGLMVGRTPEYLGRRVETREMTFALLALLVHPFFILAGTALFSALPWGAASVRQLGAHGFTEILYEFTSAAANNGSGFEGLGDNTVPWNVATGVIMLLARYIPIMLPLAIAGSLASKRPAPENSGTLRTDTPLFGCVLLGSVLFIGALLFLPVAVLGPLADHLTAHATLSGQLAAPK